MCREAVQSKNSWIKIGKTEVIVIDSVIIFISHD